MMIASICSREMFASAKALLPASAASAGACFANRACKTSGEIWKASDSGSSAKYRVAMPFFPVNTFFKIARERGANVQNCSDACNAIQQSICA